MSASIRPLALGGGALLGGRSDKRGEATAKLNLVSLMDIFTILVFFLMVNTGDVEVLQPDESIVLPQSFTTVKPDTSPLIKVNSEALYFKEQRLASLSDIPSSKELLQPLYVALTKQASQDGRPADSERSISIMATVDLPYDSLKKILNACAQAGFRDISLAVEYSTRGDATAVAEV